MRREDEPLVGPPHMDAPPRPPLLGTPPGTPPDSRETSEDESSAVSPPREMQSGSARESAPGVSASIVSKGGQRKPQTADDDDVDEEFHDIALDPSVGIVTKSIYKEKRGGFLSRLRDASSAMVKSKYAAPSDGPNHAVVIPAKAIPLRDPARAFSQDTPECDQGPTMGGADESVAIVLEEEEPIDVAIESPVPVEPALSLQPNTQDSFGNGNEAQNEEHDVAPQVVIHSAESDSDSGFATLNPIINRPARGKRVSASSAIPAGPANGAKTPVLLSLPIDEEPTTTSSNERLVLIIHALGATGLAKVEKFGTQSTQLEMRLCESADDLSSGASHLSYLRTALHKKGGSEAQWNQQFSTGLRSKTKQMLHVAVRTHSKMIVGEAMIALASVGETLYDQHYPLYRTSDDIRRESTGLIHLQLRILPSTQFSSLGFSSIARSAGRCARVAAPGPIPAVLRKGALMFKVPYHTNALMGSAAVRRQWVAVAGDGPGETVCITWCDPIDTTEKSRRLDVCLITEIREGVRTKAFERLLQNEPSSVARENDRCFSIISKTRTLDLVASSKEEALIWIDGLRKMVFVDSTQDLEAADPSMKIIDGFRHSAMLKQNSSTSSTTTKKHLLLQWRSTIFDFARHKEVDSIVACLQDGCPIDLLETGTGDTLLMLACRFGDARLVELCLQWRAKNDPHPEFGETALQVAVNAGHAECLGLILRTAAVSEMDSEIANHIDSSNDAPLHVAARKGDLACMQLLLHHGADICVVDEFGRTPLHCAVLSGGLDCVAYLLDVGGDSVLNAGDHDGDTALHYAALSGVDSIVKLLLESAADVQSSNVHGEMPLDLARREKHPASEKLIAQYHHVVGTVPAVCNEPASSLLMLHQKREIVENDRTADAMDYGNDENGVGEDEDSEASIEPSKSPVRRGPIGQFYADDGDEDDDIDYYVTHSARSSSSSSRSTQPISSSARVREVLAIQRQRASLHRAPPPVPPLRFHTARDELRSRYVLDVDYTLPARLAYTERIDREPLPYRAYPPHSRHPDYEDCLHSYERTSHPYAGDRGYSHPPVVTRSHSMSVHHHPNSGFQHYSHQAYDEYGRWYGSDQHPSSLSFRHPNAAERRYPHRQHNAWHDAFPEHSLPTLAVHVPAPIPPPPLLRDVWDTYYSDEGYPYYMNRTTGQSQWENPYELMPPSSPSAAASDPAANASARPVTAPSISPDAQVRIRPTATRESASSKAQDGQTQAAYKVPPSTTHVHQEDSPPDDDLQLPASPCESPSSKYEARTGMKLSINVASPQRQDENRPVFIASPRARSPRKAVDAREAELSDASFGKSPRASSPRGKSKNVQILEVKRANNLAMALASFKINDRNDQIVQALTALDERVVSAELLVCLQRFFPTEEEAALLRAYTGSAKSLGPAERFFFLLLQVPDIAQRIDCFLYKLRFGRSYRSVYSRIQVVKRACRDLVENYSFVQALTEFFKKGNVKSLQSFRSCISVFRAQFLPRIDEKLHSFHDDLQKAAEIELLDVELQISRLIAGARTVQAFVDKTSPPGDRDAAAHDTLHRFLAESRGKLTDLETEYEGLGQWENRVLDLFGESKATCQLTSILECLCSMLDK